MPLPAAAILAPAIAKSAFGLYQGIKGANLAKKAVRPEYEIPEEVYQNLSDAQRLSLEGMPAEQKKQYLQNIQRSSLFGLKQLGSRQAGIAGIGDIVQSERDALGQLFASDASARMENIRGLAGARSTVAGYKDKAFDINEMQPFQEQAAAAEAMKGAGIQNVFGGLKEGMGTMESRDIYKLLLGGSSAAGTTGTPESSGDVLFGGNKAEDFTSPQLNQDNPLLQLMEKMKDSNFDSADALRKYELGNLLNRGRY